MTPRERAEAIVQTRDLSWQAQRDLIQGHIEEAEREAGRKAARIAGAKAARNIARKARALPVEPLPEIPRPVIDHAFRPCHYEPPAIGGCWIVEAGCHEPGCSRPASEHAFQPEPLAEVTL